MNDRLAALLSEVFGIRRDLVTPELTKADVGSWDSLKQMDLVTSLEREYDILLEISDIISMVSVCDIIKVLQNKGVRF